VAVAGYYDELRSACPSCTVVAADVIDSGSYVNWLRHFRSATTGNPKLWGLHNYTDVTYGTTSGTDGALAQMPGQVWVEETGGIVVRRDGKGHELLRHDETRAANAVDNAFAIVATGPRISRIYIYQWRARVNDYFDAGLVRPDGSLRASYTNLVTQLKALQPTRSRSAWTVRWAKKKARTLVLHMRCRTGTCSGSTRLAPEHARAPRTQDPDRAARHAALRRQRQDAADTRLEAARPPRQGGPAPLARADAARQRQRRPQGRPHARAPAMTSRITTTTTRRYPCRT
jgi:hypothetical protein